MFKVPAGLASRTRELMNSVTLNSLNNGKGFNMYLPGILRAFPKPVPLAITSPAIPKYRGESFQFRKLSCISSNYCSTTHQFLSSLESSTPRLVGKRAFHSSRRAEIKFIFSSKSPKNGNKPFVKVYKVSPFFIIFATASIFTFILTSTIVVIPLIFHFFFPFLLCSFFLNNSKNGRKISFTKMS